MPPEVILDRYIRSDMCHKRGCSGYVGKLDVDRVEPITLAHYCGASNRR
jgi:hypothetical protein